MNRQRNHFKTVEQADIKIFLTSTMVGLVEVEHHLFMHQWEGEDTLEEVITGALWTCFLYQAVAVCSFPVKRGMRRREHATKGMVTSHFAS